MTGSNATPFDTLGTLPIQATGSGVADLEIAYEQMQLMADDAETTAPDTATAPSDIPTEAGEDAAESAAHPS